MFPPLIMHLRVSTADHNRSGIWLPLFLIWLLLLPLVALALMLTLLADFFLLLFGHGFQGYTILLVHALAVLANMRGMSIDIHDNTRDIEIQFL